MPNGSYTETCTTGALIQYSDSLSLMFGDSKYHDVAEIAIYNTFLGCIGENGKTFFYTNPLATSSTPRYTWHAVPCCTKYGLLIFGELSKYIYSYGERDVYVNQYIGSTARLGLKDGALVLKQEADWAENGWSSVTVVSGAGGLGRLMLRLPEWSKTCSIKVNGEAVGYVTENGFAVIEGLKDGDTVTINADMTPFRVYADENVAADAGMVALQRGPFVYCMEGVDNETDYHGRLTSVLVIPEDGAVSEKRIEDLYGGVTALTVEGEILTGEGKERYTVTLVPFFARANRGTSSVYVWLTEDPSLAELNAVSFGNSIELKSMGAKYSAISNVTNPTGTGSRKISVIADGKTSYENADEQYDGYGATLSDELGKKQQTVWFGVRFGNGYGVSHVVFWEGGHWTNGGWFGDTPYVQVMVNNRWVDAPCTVTPEYPSDSMESQMPSNTAYVFTLESPVVCTAVRVLGKYTGYSGHHVSCAEIEVYGMSAEDVTGSPGTDNGGETSAPEDTGGEEPSRPGNVIIIIAIAAGGLAAMALTYIIARRINGKDAKK